MTPTYSTHYNIQSSPGDAELTLGWPKPDLSEDEELAKFAQKLADRMGIENPDPDHWPRRHAECDCDSCYEHRMDPNYLECEDCRKDIFSEEISVNNVCRDCHEDSWDEEFIPRGKKEE